MPITQKTFNEFQFPECWPGFRHCACHWENRNKKDMTFVLKYAHKSTVCILGVQSTYIHTGWQARERFYWEDKAGVKLKQKLNNQASHGREIKMLSESGSRSQRPVTGQSLAECHGQELWVHWCGQKLQQRLNEKKKIKISCFHFC